jgi:uncharacterized protein YjdB
MKKQLLTLLFLFALTFLQAQDWEEVGTDNTGALITGDTSLADMILDANGNPYIAYLSTGIQIQFNDGTGWERLNSTGFTNLGRQVRLALDTNGDLYLASVNVISDAIEVYRLDGTNWTSIGQAGISFPVPGLFDMKFSPSGILHIAYRDQDNGGKITLRELTNTGWEAIGTRGFTSGRASQINLEFSSTGTPFIAYRDEARQNKATVEYFDGTSWVLLGAGVSSGQATYLDMEVDETGTPVLAYRDESTARAAVIRFDGSFWTPLGPDAFVSSESANHIDLEMNSNGELHLLFGDQRADSKITLLRFVEQSQTWSSVGEQGFSAGPPSAINLNFTSTDQIVIGYRDQVLKGLTVRRYLGDRLWETIGRPIGVTTFGSPGSDMVLDSNGLPYVVYTDNLNFDRVKARRFNGASWEPLGSDVLPFGIKAIESSIAINSQNIPFIATRETTSSSRLTVSSFDGANWNNLGNPGEIVGQGRFPKVVVDASDVVYVAYIDQQAEGRLTVKFHNQGIWTTLGTPGFSTGVVNIFDFGVAPDGTPYVAYADASQSSNGRIQRFTGNSWEFAGVSSFNSGSTTAVALGFNSQGVPHVAYQGLTNLGPRFSRLNGTSWEQVGLSNVDTSFVYEMDISFDDRDIPYLVYTDNSELQRRSKVKRFRNGSWEPVGSLGFSLGSSVDNAIDTFEDKVYVGYNSGPLFVQSIELPVIPDLPWIETFTDLANGTTNDDGETAWSSLITTQGSFQVQDGKLLLSGASSGSEAFFDLEPIDISGFADVGIQVTVGDLDQNNKEANDYVRLFYSIDGATEVLFAELTDDIDTQVVSTGPLSGSSLRIRGEVKVSFDNEFFTIDEIRVESNSSEPVVVTGVVVSPEEVILDTANSVFQLEAEIFPANATNKEVIWSSSDPLTASVNRNGFVSRQSAGTAIITATTVDGGFTSSSTITVPPHVMVIGVSVNPETATIAPGDSDLVLEATVLPSNATNPAFTWSSSNPAIATIDATGRVTGISEGTVMITATTEENAFTASAEITVVEEEVADLPWIESFDGLNDGSSSDGGDTGWGSSAVGFGNLEVDNGRLVLKAERGGTTANFRTEEIDISGATNVSIKLLVGDLDQNNKETSDFIRLFYILDGQEVEFANLVDDIDTQEVSVDGISGSTLVFGAEVKVSWLDESFFMDEIRIAEESTSAISVTGVEVTPATATISLPGSGINLNAEVFPANATNQRVIWSVSDGATALVDQNGLVTPVAVGVVEVIARTEDGNFIDSSIITVENSVNCSDISLEVAEVQDATTCFGTEGFIRLEVSGFTGALTYTWSHDPQLNGPLATGLSTRLYQVRVEDENGCSAEREILISQPEQPNVSTSPYGIVNVDDEPFELSGGMPLGGTYTGQGITNNIFDPSSVSPGFYSIVYTYTDPATSCSASVTQSIQVLGGDTLGVTGFNLINANTNSVITNLTGNEVISVGSLPTTALNIEALATEDAGSVRLVLSGRRSVTRIESVAPYALFGDSGGNFEAGNLPVGSYAITATAYSLSGARGDAGTPVTVQFEIVEESDPCVDFSMTLLTSIDPLSCGGTEGQIQVDVSGATGQVQYTWSHDSQLNRDAATGLGAGTYTVTATDENGCSSSLSVTLTEPGGPSVSLLPFTDVAFDAAPFALTGGSPAGGTYSGNGVSNGQFDADAVGPGLYQISYSYTDPVSGCSDMAVQNLRVLGPPSESVVSSMILIDPVANSDLDPIIDGQVISLGALGLFNGVNIRAEVSEPVGSLVFQLNGPVNRTQTESVAPYALFGDRGGNYNRFNLPEGNYQLTVTPYSGASGSGTVGEALVTNFTISLGLPTRSLLLDLRISPNPVVNTAELYVNQDRDISEFSVFDVAGRRVFSKKPFSIRANSAEQIDLSSLQAGVYSVRVVIDDFYVINKRVIVRE